MYIVYIQRAESKNAITAIYIGSSYVTLSLMPLYTYPLVSSKNQYGRSHLMINYVMEIKLMFGYGYHVLITPQIYIYPSSPPPKNFLFIAVRSFLRFIQILKGRIISNCPRPVIIGIGCDI